MIISRRKFFQTGAMAGVFAAAGQGASAQTACENPHPLSPLLDIETGQHFTPRENVFNVALFMTAQKSYASCGEAFLGMDFIVGRASKNALEIKPVLVIPKISDQTDPDNRENLSWAQNAENFTILTGSLRDVRVAAAHYDAIYEFENGKVSGHTLDGFMLSPSGEQLFRHDARDHLTFADLSARIIDACSNPKNENMCGLKPPVSLSCQRPVM